MPLAVTGKQSPDSTPKAQRDGRRGARTNSPQRRGSFPVPFIQRKPTCACGGGCPRCKEHSAQKGLEIGQLQDGYEREADHVAEQMIRMPEPQLQRACSCGNHTMAGGECSECSKKNRLGLETKLKVNEPGDIYEREADRVADQVLATPAHPAVNGTPPRIQRSSGQSNGQMDAAPASVGQALADPGRPLEPALRQDMEQRFGHDFSRVRVHTGAEAAESARSVNALAYTMDRDIVFGAGRYAPATSAGRRLIAHELTHVLQQASGRQTPDIQRTPDTTHAAQKCGISTLKCPPKSVLTNESSSATLGTLVHNVVQEKYLQEHQSKLGDENFILIDRGWGEVHTKTESSQIISRLAVLDPPVHGAFAKGAKKGERATGTLAQRPDILNDQLDEVSEIKSCTPEGEQEGRNDLVDYFSRLALAPEKVPPSGNRRKRSWHTSSWRPADFDYNQGNPPFQVVFSMPQRGLILYAIWSCRPKQEKDDPQPPIFGEKPRFEVKGEPKSTPETKGKRDGRPGKGNGTGKPGQKLPGPSGPQPTLTIPKSVAAIIVILGLLALATGPGKIGALIGAFLRGLGITLGIVAGATAAFASGRAGGKSPVKPVPVPVPGSEETTSPPGRTGSASGRKKSASEEELTRPAAAKRQVVKLDYIESLNLDRLSNGMVVPVLLSDLKSKHGVAILQVTNVVKEKNSTTAEFRSLQDRMGGAEGVPSARTQGGNKFYTVTHPYSSSEPPRLVGSVMKIGPDPQWFATYLENLADQLEAAGQKDEANQVRQEVRRVMQLAKSANR